MKKWVLYIMSVVFCMGFFACTAEEGLVDNSGDKNNEEDVLVSFNLNIPSARASSESEFDPNYEWERYIDATDIRVFVFKDNIYQEEVKGLFLDGNDGDETRRITGRVKSSYEGDKVNLVVLTGLKSRGVAVPELTPGQTTATDLYQQLKFNYDEAWSFYANEKKYIPMWGVSEKFKIIEEDKINDAGTIYMYRAIAKIDIKVNNGDGITGFKITKLELVNAPIQGYCAPLENPAVNGEPMEKPFVPSYQANNNSFEINLDDDGEKTTTVENKIYVPEMNYWPSPNFHIKITATVLNKEHEYTIYMRSNQTDAATSFEIIRNHKYIININSVTKEGDALIGYSVNSWGSSTIELPFS